MKITDKREDELKNGDIICDNYTFYMIVYDHNTRHFRLLSLPDGYLLKREYKTCMDIRLSNPKFKIVKNSELIILK